MTENYHSCEMSKEDIELYARMMYALNSGRDNQAGEMKRFLRSYGRDVKEIQSSIGGHLDICFLCSAHYRECLEEQGEADRFTILLPRYLGQI